MYTAVVLREQDRRVLVDKLCEDYPPWYETIAHHMTINMNSADAGPCAGRVGEEAVLTVTGFAINDLVAAVRVETDIPSVNETKHVTLAVNRAGGGKPKHSNDLQNWKDIPKFQIRGVIKEV